MGWKRTRLAVAFGVLSTGLLGWQTWSSQTAFADQASDPFPVVAARTADSLVDGYGVCVHLNWLDTPYKDAPTVIAALKTLGVRHVRDDFYLNSPRQWAAIRAAAAQGIKFDLITGKPTDTASAATYVDTIAAQVPGAVDSLEGSNEWDISGRSGWAGELRARQAALYSAAKANAATRSIPVLSPALAFVKNYQQLGSMASVSDLGNGHFYSGGRTPDLPLDPGLAVLRSMTDAKPDIISEAGFHNAMNATSSHPATPEDVAGDYTPRMLLESYRRGVDRVYSYQLLDHFADPSLKDPERHFGLLRNDLSPKPAYTAMRTVLNLAADPGPAFTPGSLAYRVTGGGSDLRQLLVQKRSGQFVLFLWRDVSMWDATTQKRLAVTPTTVHVQLPSALGVSLYQPTRGLTPVASATTTDVPVTLGAEAMALTLDPAAGATATPAPPTSTTSTTPTTPADPSATPDPTASVGTSSGSAAGPTSGPTAMPTPGSSSPVPAGGATASPVAIAAAPVPVAATPRNRSALLTWAQPSSAAPVTGYVVRDSSGRVVAAPTASARSVVVASLVNGRRYAFTISASSAAGSSPRTSFRTVTPVAAPSRPRVHARPYGRGTLLVSWRPSFANGAVVRRYEARIGRRVILLAPARRAVLVHGVRRGRPVRVLVRAQNAAGWGLSGWSAAVRPR